jgi:hypothetical protein
MARRVFFSFHHTKEDTWRTANVRSSNLIDDSNEFGYIDSVDWEKLKATGDVRVKRWITEQLQNTSVTVVLIGSHTAERKWVNYEILESWNRGNAVIGIRIHGMKDQSSQTSAPGANPFDQLKFADGRSMASLCPIYDWVIEDGRKYMGDWVEDAFQARQILPVPSPRTQYSGDEWLERTRTQNAGSTPQLTPRRDPGEEFISDLGIKTAIKYDLQIDARVTQDGFPPFWLSAFKWLKKKRSLHFKVIKCDAPKPRKIFWKVKNTGREASDLDALRGQILPDDGSETRKETTLYSGEHYVECYVVIDDICVAKAHLPVPIGTL